MNKRVKLLGVVLCAALSMTMFALAGCGSTSQSDEELIKADINVSIGTEISPSDLAKELRSDDSLAVYESYGLDIDAVAQSLSQLYKVDVKNVTVNGDKATATLVATVPTFGEEMTDLIAEEAEKLDLTNATEEEAVQAAAKILNDVFTRSDYPVTKQEFTVDYIKKDGKWQMADSKAVSDKLNSVMGLSEE